MVARVRIDPPAAVSEVGAVCRRRRMAAVAATAVIG
jgi:hypothetical protein